MDGGHHRHRLARDVHIGEVQADFVHRRQTLQNGFGAQVIHLHQDVILVRAAAAAFLDLLVHRARDEVARSQILERGRIALHEAFAFAIEQDRAFAAAAFSQEHARVVDAGGVELPEFHILQRNACTRRHAQAVARIDEGIGGRMVDAPGTASCQQGGFGFEHINFARFHFQGDHAEHVAVGVADQVERHPFHQELGMYREVLLVQGVQHGVAGAVGRGAGALHRLFTMVGRVAAKRTLVNGAVGIAVERHAEVFHLVDDLGRLAAHELDGVLVAEPVRSLDGVVEMPFPMVFTHIAETGAHAALRRHRMRTGGEDLGEHSHFEPGARQLQRSAHAGAACAHNHHIKLAPWQVLHHCCHLFRASTEPAAPSRHSLPARRSRRHAGQGARKRVSHNP